MQQYEELEHMIRVEHVDQATKVYCLSHHGVFKESNSTTKLCVVFNGSFNIGNGTSLNAHLLVQIYYRNLLMYYYDGVVTDMSL